MGELEMRFFPTNYGEVGTRARRSFGGKMRNNYKKFPQENRHNFGKLKFLEKNPTGET